MEKAQERTNPIDEKATGLYRKFNIERTDGSSEPGCKHHECEYFVLDTTHDPYAIPAIAAYVAACEAEYPLLAADLKNRYLQSPAQEPCIAPPDGPQL